MTFVSAYSTRTGKKLPAPVPERWLDHPVLGEHLSKTPRRRAREAATAQVEVKAPTTEAPAAGDAEKE